MTANGRFNVPSRVELAVVQAALAPWRRYVTPVFEGLANIPSDRPLLFVGNHTLMGVLDVPLLFAELWEREGIFLRALGDHVHFAVPVWRRLLSRYGAVDGTPEACANLFAAKQCVLVFPGGGREVTRRKNDRYTLHWGRRTGFARLALTHGCTIVPFAQYGASDAFDVVLDAEDWLRSPAGPWLKRFGVREDLLFPLVRGRGPTPIPRRVRLFFRILPPIDPRDFGTDGQELDAAVALRDQVQRVIEDALDALDNEAMHGPVRRLESMRRWP